MELPVAMITGAGRGIGRATAMELAKRYRLALIARSADELAETARLCGQGETIAADVGRAELVEQAVERTLSRFGQINALVHCAGVAPMRSVEEMTLDEWRGTIDVNLSALFYFCRRLWPVWRRQGGGVLVNVSSYAARDPFAGLGAYGAAKAGANLLALALAREGEAIGVRVHSVAPAATETAMFRSLFSPQQYPTEKTLEPVAVARVIAQCVHGDLACTSGEVIYVHKTF